MNITVKTYGSGSFVCRPDTTWERESRDFYIPEFCGALLYSPVVFARISKAGKCIAPKFVRRYYDGMNFGVLFYPGAILKGSSSESFAFASILDHTSVLPFPLYLPEVFRSRGNAFVFRKDGDILYGTDTGTDFTGPMENCISEASVYTSQRIGDIVVMEIGAPETVLAENEKRAVISADFCDNRLFELSLIR